jgi:hypothetical protein
MVLPSAAWAAPGVSNHPAITLVNPSPVEGATLTTGEVSFAFTDNRTPKQTASLSCTLAGPTAASVPCAAPMSNPNGSSSSAAYSGLANGSYTFTATLVLTDGGTVTVSRSFAVAVAAQTCSGDLSASVPAQDGASAPGTSALDAVIYRGNDIELDADLTSDCADSWTYAWTYRLGDGPSLAVPADWVGATSATLTVPKWTLSFYDLTHEDYTFTVTATPPAGSTASPLSADLTLRVAGRAPVAGFSPTGFAMTIPPGTYTYSAFGGTPSSLSPDWAPDDQEMGFTWYAEIYGADEIPPVSGQGTPTVEYTWTPVQYFLIRLTVCAVDAPTSPTNPCTTTEDFVFSTSGG